MSPAPVHAAEVVLPCADVDETLRFFTERLGFRLLSIYPADRPRTLVLAGFGLRIRFEQHAGDADAGAGAGRDPGVLRLLCRAPDEIAGGARTLIAPGGTRIELAEIEPPVSLPPLVPSLVVSRPEDGAFAEGRAGMRYRDLIPDRQGGRFIASHIQIERAGPVPDYVHFHRIHLQMIFCHRGWVRVVYEDQGPPFELCAGDLVLQPPGIRHRVLESSAGLEVVEIGAPADHETHADHDLALPTAAVRPDRDFGGQRFVRHRAAAASWQPWRADGFESRDLGIAAATAGVAAARVARALGPAPPVALDHHGELLFLFIHRGAATLHAPGGPVPLTEGSAAVIPRAAHASLADCAPGLELLEVRLPAR